MNRFFVYGTLKDGECNSRVWPHEPVSIESAILDGAVLYHLGAYPAICKGDGKVLGQLWTVDDQHVAATLARLDRLEGYQGKPTDLYDREVVEVKTDDGDVPGSGQTVQAYVYFFNRPLRLSQIGRRIKPINGVQRWHGAVGPDDFVASALAGARG
jgi:gamma-glutamylcyclotransferase (GGCT)/AIG2-like uncharacterized protein YtfP